MSKVRARSWLVPLAVGGLGLGFFAMIRSGRAAPNRSALPPVETWKLARITEYSPDVPDSAPASVKRQEGGAYARSPEFPIITLEQHRSDPERYPFATVAADTTLDGNVLRKGIGPRVYFAAYPSDIFRIYDTGRNFRGANKKITDGAEPFDIAIKYQGDLKGRITTRTSYFIDWEDALLFPARLRRRTDA